MRATAYSMPYRQEVYDELPDTARTKAHADLDRAANRLRRAGLDVSEQVLDGQAAEAIVARAEPTGLIVMTSHGRGGLKRWLLGSVAEKLVREAPVPAVLVPASIRGKVLAQQAETAFAPVAVAGATT
jgi:nucleotide-binding universal stress UspA family protein